MAIVSMFACNVNGLGISSSIDHQTSIDLWHISTVLRSRRSFSAVRRRKDDEVRLVRWKTSRTFSSKSFVSVHSARFVHLRISVSSVGDDLFHPRRADSRLCIGDLLFRSILVERILDDEFEMDFSPLDRRRNVVSRRESDRESAADSHRSLAGGFSRLDLREQTFETTLFDRSCLRLFASRSVVQRRSLSSRFHHRRSRISSDQWLFFLRVSTQTNRSTFSSESLRRLFRNRTIDRHFPQISSTEGVHRWNGKSMRKARSLDKASKFLFYWRFAFVFFLTKVQFTSEKSTTGTTTMREENHNQCSRLKETNNGSTRVHYSFVWRRCARHKREEKRREERK